MKKNILKFLILFIVILNLGIGTAFAEDLKPAENPKSDEKLTPAFTQTKIPKPETLPGPTGTDKRKALTQGILPKLAVFLVGSTASFSLLFLIIAGVRFATFYGNEEGVQHAKKQAIYAVIGLIVSLMAYTIVRIISNFNYTEGAPAENKPGPVHNEIPGANTPIKNPEKADSQPA